MTKRTKTIVIAAVVGACVFFAYFLFASGQGRFFKALAVAAAAIILTDLFVRIDRRFRRGQADSEEERLAVDAKKGSLKDTVDSLVVAFVIAMILRAFVVQAYKIPSESMVDTLLVGDHILVNKLSYAFGSPDRGDVVVFEFPLEPAKSFIKRIVGVPGDRIEIVDKQLYRNGQKVEAAFARYDDDSLILAGPGASEYMHYRARRDNVDPFTVPEGLYWVMGDNRDNSEDSRFWGFVAEDAVVGKAFVIYWSSNMRGGEGIHWERILKGIH